ncbi:MFS transporter [Paenibacillus lycopersici]|uniref:MFS transporter n=1 Tax=Paenibacillus lycopersici TaxID=2704462 RepID=A0A6C0G7V4_9BACL|nr:MFS transporter [Paenibacillus lycopersici]QHT63817.1 MFS transporter [Paenibacillus lycopersici]
MIQIFSTFEHSTNLELAIRSLEKCGIDIENIFAVPLTNRKTERKMFDSIHRSDGISLISTGAILGTALAVIGASVGFKLAWGPIYWGLIGTGAGFILGLLIDLFYYKVIKKQQRLLRGKNSEVILIVECEENTSDLVEDILWHHFALGTARIMPS